MIEFEPTIEPSSGDGPSDLSGQTCINSVARFLSDKERVAAATTPLDETSLSLPSRVISVANVELGSDEMHIQLDPDEYKLVIANFRVKPSGEPNEA